MKKMMLIGGMIGFGIGVGCGLCTEGANWSGILLRAAATSLVGGLLLRWWSRNWIATLRELHLQQIAAMAKAQEANGPKVPWKR